VSLADWRLSLSLAQMSGGVLALLFADVPLYAAFRYEQQLLKPLGEARSVIFLQLSAFNLLCRGVHIVWDGVYELSVRMLHDGHRIVKRALHESGAVVGDALLARGQKEHWRAQIAFEFGLTLADRRFRQIGSPRPR
jgi:hypothetical protein